MRLLSLLVCLATALSLHAKSTICLNMIVKNESACIREALDSIKPYINYWVIVDTGSSDGTRDIIKEHMKDIPGELHERPWVDFAHNRNEALQLAKDKADYLFWLDGDDWVEISENFSKELTEDAYLIEVKNEDCAFYRPHLLKNTIPWKWKGVLHEHVDSDISISAAFLKDITYRYSRAGIRACPVTQYADHVKILREALKKEPGNTRYTYYLAQTHRDGGKLVKALKWYQKRLDLGGHDEETFYCLLQIALIHKELGLDLETTINSFYRAHRHRPHRLEPIYYLAEIYNRRQEYALAYECLRGVLLIPRPSSPDLLLRKVWVEDWGLLYQLSICTYYVNQYRESLAISEKLLENPHLPESIHKEVERNREFAFQKMQENAIYISLDDNSSKEATEEELATKMAAIIQAKINENLQKK